ncbi:MAG TPA: phosphoenolpyruvate--protein phosphotransferase [Desulfosporosinus sp.]|nr:phosphoenolpyruvate--protein phosphotransferase [Desulfosporosinus sp.]
MRNKEGLQGLGVSKGIALGQALWLYVAPAQTEGERRLSEEEVPVELEKFQVALKVAAEQVRDLTETLEAKFPDEAAIFEAHALILEDEELGHSVQGYLENDRIPADQAVNLSIRHFKQIFLAMEDPYFQARAADLEDIGQRLILNLQGTPPVNLQSLPPGTILVADDLTPSQTAGLDPESVVGLITRQGGKTSHTAILAKTLGIPAVVGCPGLEQIKDGDSVILDGEKGDITLRPTAVQWAEAERRREEYSLLKQSYMAQVALPAVTLDGHLVTLGVNLAHPSAATEAVKAGAEEVGLFRTEFLYLGRQTAPSEEEQFVAYRTLVEKMQGRPVIFRTLDVGGDKKVPYLGLAEEDNPFLGYRALRICLQEPELFSAQLRALLRASAFGPSRIMFPMVATLEELREAKECVSRAQLELSQEGQAFDPNIEIGIMIEIPSAAIMAEEFAQEVDFFSIGTNDLVQYTLAADRLNPKLGRLYQNHNPAVLRLIAQVVKAAHHYGRRVGVCGEMAGQLSGALILLGLGVDELSMSVGSLPEIKSLIRETSSLEGRKLADSLLRMKTPTEVEAAVTGFLTARPI